VFVRFALTDDTDVALIITQPYLHRTGLSPQGKRRESATLVISKAASGSKPPRR
jgi:hypothetical protein